MPSLLGPPPNIVVFLMSGTLLLLCNFTNYSIMYYFAFFHNTDLLSLLMLTCSTRNMTAYVYVYMYFFCLVFSWFTILGIGVIEFICFLHVYHMYSFSYSRPSWWGKLSSHFLFFTGALDLTYFCNGNRNNNIS